MGDPETEVVMPRLKSDLVEIFEAMAKQELDKVVLEVDERAATTIMMVSGGYPEDYEKGKPIFGLDNQKESTIFHAGTIFKENEILTNGGRVLAISSFGNSIFNALEKSYHTATKISFENMYYRKDLGFDLK